MLKNIVLLFFVVITISCNYPTKQINPLLAEAVVKDKTVPSSSRRRLG
jgi:hypothetical protein